MFGMGETATGFLCLTIKEGEPMYVSCSQGLVEIVLEPKGSNQVLIKLRSTNPKIGFHKNAERLRRDLGDFK